MPTDPLTLAIVVLAALALLRAAGSVADCIVNFLNDLRTRRLLEAARRRYWAIREEFRPIRDSMIRANAWRADRVEFSVEDTRKLMRYWQATDDWLGRSVPVNPQSTLFMSRPCKLNCLATRVVFETPAP